MRYCVLKDTTTVIDGSFNDNFMMVQNAINAGYTSEEVEILSHEQYESRKMEKPLPKSQPTEIEQIRLEMARSNAEMFEMMINMLGGGL